MAIPFRPLFHRVLPYLRRAPVGAAALALLVIPGAAAVNAAGPEAAPVAAAPGEVPGARTATSTAEGEGVAVTASYPLIPGASAFGGHVRTDMAEARTEFVTEHAGADAAEPVQDAELVQDYALIAASGDVLGARITEERTVDGAVTAEATTRWYDGSAEEVLPWTALFGGPEDLAALDAEVARQLALTGDGALPDGLVADGSAEPLRAAAGADSGAAGGGPGPGAAWDLAAEYPGSPLADVAFDTDGGLMVSVPGSDAVSVESDLAGPLLSEFGARARDAAVADAPLELSEGPATAPLDCDRVPCVSLTFDDGPGEHTGRLLDELDAYSAKATFYLLGQLVGEKPELVRRMAEDGHELGNHSWKHDDLAGKSGGAVADDLERTSDAIEEASDIRPATVRPPYGSYNGTTLASFDAPFILWDVDTMDWRDRDAGKVADAAVGSVSPGSVVLMHDIHSTTVDAVPDVLERLYADGYHFVTVDELFAGGELEDNEAYQRLP